MRKAGEDYVQFCEMKAAIKEGRKFMQLSPDYLVMSRNFYQEIVSDITGKDLKNKITVIENT